MDITKAFGATDLQAVYQGSRHIIGDTATFPLTEEHWTGNLRLRVPGDHPERPRSRSTRGYTRVLTELVHVHIWEKWDKLAKEKAVEEPTPT